MTSLLLPLNYLEGGVNYSIPNVMFRAHAFVDHSFVCDTDRRSSTFQDWNGKRDDAESGGFFQYGAEMSKDVEPQVELSESQYELDINPQYIPGTCLSSIFVSKTRPFPINTGGPIWVPGHQWLNYEVTR